MMDQKIERLANEMRGNFQTVERRSLHTQMRLIDRHDSGSKLQLKGPLIAWIARLTSFAWRSETQPQRRPHTLTHWATD